MSTPNVDQCRHTVKVLVGVTEEEHELGCYMDDSHDVHGGILMWINDEGVCRPESLEDPSLLPRLRVALQRIAALTAQDGDTLVVAKLLAMNALGVPLDSDPEVVKAARNA